LANNNTEDIAINVILGGDKRKNPAKRYAWVQSTLGSINHSILIYFSLYMVVGFGKRKENRRLWKSSHSLITCKVGRFVAVEKL
jgi:hypothetical protein